MARNSISYKFYFHKLHKTWIKGKTPPAGSYQTPIHDCNFCIVRALDKFISRTKCCRSGEEFSQLLPTFINLNKAILLFFISGWFRNVLRETEIEIQTFKPHSTRSASISKAGLIDASM